MARWEPRSLKETLQANLDGIKKRIQAKQQETIQPPLGASAVSGKLLGAIEVHSLIEPEVDVLAFPLGEVGPKETAVSAGGGAQVRYGDGRWSVFPMSGGRTDSNRRRH